MVDLKADYVVLSSDWCLNGNASVVFFKFKDLIHFYTINKLTLILFFCQRRLWHDRPLGRGGARCKGCRGGASMSKAVELQVCRFIFKYIWEIWISFSLFCRKPEPFKKVFANPQYVVLKVWKMNPSRTSDWLDQVGKWFCSSYQRVPFQEFEIRLSKTRQISLIFELFLLCSKPPSAKKLTSW